MIVTIISEAFATDPSTIRPNMPSLNRGHFGQQLLCYGENSEPWHQLRPAAKHALAQRLIVFGDNERQYVIDPNHADHNSSAQQVTALRCYTAGIRGFLTEQEIASLRQDLEDESKPYDDMRHDDLRIALTMLPKANLFGLLFLAGIPVRAYLYLLTAFLSLTDVADSRVQATLTNLRITEMPAAMVWYTDIQDQANALKEIDALPTDSRMLEAECANFITLLNFHQSHQDPHTRVPDHVFRSERMRVSLLFVAVAIYRACLVLHLNKPLEFQVKTSLECLTVAANGQASPMKFVVTKFSQPIPLELDLLSAAENNNTDESRFFEFNPNTSVREWCELSGITIFVSCQDRSRESMRGVDIAERSLAEDLITRTGPSVITFDQSVFAGSNSNSTPPLPDMDPSQDTEEAGQESDLSDNGMDIED